MTQDAKLYYECYCNPKRPIQFLLQPIFTLVLGVITDLLGIILNEMVLVFWDKWPHCVNQLMLHLLSIRVKVCLVLEGVKHPPLKEALILLQVSRRNVVVLIVPRLLLHRGLSLQRIASDRGSGLLGLG